MSINMETHLTNENYVNSWNEHKKNLIQAGFTTEELAHYDIMYFAGWTDGIAALFHGIKEKQDDKPSS